MLGSVNEPLKREKKGIIVKEFPSEFFASSSEFIFVAERKQRGFAPEANHPAGDPAGTQGQRVEPHPAREPPPDRAHQAVRQIQVPHQQTGTVSGSAHTKLYNKCESFTRWLLDARGHEGASWRKSDILALSLPVSEKS